MDWNNHFLDPCHRALHEVTAPALLWLFPGLLHGYRPATDWDQAWVLFGGSGHLLHGPDRPAERGEDLAGGVGPAVAAIARQVGYDDPAYFSRLFNARVGQSPREFRRFGSIAGPISSF